jgi:hypothetical protein
VKLKGGTLDKRCPRRLKHLPTEPCPEGRKAMDLARNRQHGGCPWFIADAESQYCFFKYITDNAGKQCETQRIAHFLMLDDSEVKRLLSQFKTRISELFNVENPKEIFEI